MNYTTIDERIEALTMSVEILTHDVETFGEAMKEVGEAQERTDASLKELADSQKHTGGIVMEGRKPGEVQ